MTEDIKAAVCDKYYQFVVGNINTVQLNWWLKYYRVSDDELDQILNESRIANKNSAIRGFVIVILIGLTLACVYVLWKILLNLFVMLG